MHPDLETSISEFQRHVGAPAPAWPRLTQHEAAIIRAQAREMIASSKSFKNFYQATKNNAFLRVELMLEEMGEILHGIADSDPVLTLDGIVDCAYVVIGTATSFDLPFNAAFEEVHRSNMTKSSKAASHSGDKGKGDGFKPADIARVLVEYRSTR